MTTLKKVKAVQDNDCHWYVIPEEMEEKFNELLDVMQSSMESEVETAEEHFEELFSKYMTGGDLNLTQLYAEI